MQQAVQQITEDTYETGCSKFWNLHIVFMQHFLHATSIDCLFLLMFSFLAGESFRATVGLTAGYLTRPFFKIEQLIAPVYTQFARLLADAVYDTAPFSSEELQRTLNSVGIAIAVLLIVPRYTEGWDLRTDLQLVLPWMGGWVLFDIAFMVGIVLRLKAFSSEGK